MSEEKENMKSHTSAIERRASALADALSFWLGKKHDDDCVFTDKSDEGCQLCSEAEKKNYPKHKDLLAISPAVPQIIITLSKDGNKWCALIGENLQEGFAGFGEAPKEALNNLMAEWLN